MDTWTPLVNSVVDSSLWEEPAYVRVLFMTMLALKDADHIVRYDDYKLHRRANLSEEETVKALKILSSPDTRRQVMKQEFEGRRIAKVEAGWLVLNGEKYRSMIGKIGRKEYKANWMKEYRKRRKVQGKQDGAQAAIREGFEEAQSNVPQKTDYENDVSDVRGVRERGQRVLQTVQEPKSEVVSADDNQDAGTKKESQLEEPSQGLPTSGKADSAAVPGLREPEKREAPSRLQPAVAGGMAVPTVPPKTPQNDLTIPEIEPTGIKFTRP